MTETVNARAFLSRLLYTGFFSGYSPVAPGTAGTVVAVMITVGLHFLFGALAVHINTVLVFLLLYPSVKIGDAGERHFGVKDPSPVVFDEMMGYWISIMFHDFSWKMVILAFLLFRVLDIIKPYPARQVQNLDGGAGIMMDDFVAGMYTNIILVAAGL